MHTNVFAAVIESYKIIFSRIIKFFLRRVRTYNFLNDVSTSIRLKERNEHSSKQTLYDRAINHQSHDLKIAPEGYFQFHSH